MKRRVAEPIINRPATAISAGKGAQSALTPLSLMRSEGGKAVMVKLEGAGPGAQGHQSRFSVVTATVFVAQ